jgi:hypothetical protein
MKLLEKLRNYSTDGPAGNDLQFWPIVAGVAGIAASAYGGWKANKDRQAMQNDPRFAAISPGQVKQHMAPVQQQISAMGGTVGQMQEGYGEMMGIGRQMMDPRSRMNQQQFGLMKQQGAEQLALQNLLSRRQAASMGQASGISAAQGRAAQTQMGQDIGQRFQQQMIQSRQQGIQQLMANQGLLGQIGGMQQNMGGMQMGIQENIAQADIAGRNQRRNMEMQRIAGNQQAWSGVGSGLMGAAGGFGGDSGTAVNDYWST